MTRFDRKAFFLAVLVASWSLAFPRSVAARDYQLTVNAGNEIGRISRFWQAAVGSDHMYMVIDSARTGVNLKSAYGLAARELGMRQVRGHGIFDDDVGIYHEVNGQPTYTWDKLDQIFDYITSIGMNPLVEVGFMPSDLASGTKTFGWYGGVPGNVTLPKDYTRWSDLLYNVAQHCIDRYGLERVRTWNWEIWNEPDLPRGDFFMGTIQDYFRLYDAAVAGLLRADPMLRVGGPSVAVSGNNWISDFIDHCMISHVKLDFITWHTYPAFKADATAIPAAHRNVQSLLDRKKVQYPQLSVENYLTEWNTTYLGGTSYHHEMAASFVAKTVHGLFASQNGVKPPDTAAFWVISELWEEWQTTADAFDVMGMVTRTHDVRKPSFLAYQMMASMRDIELDFRGGITDPRGLNGWATISDDKKQVEILIYDHNFVSGTTAAADSVSTVVDNVTLNVSGLPFAKPSVTVQRYGVDHDHNNAYTVAVQAGNPLLPSAATWTSMQEAGQLRTIQPDEVRPTTGAALTLTFQQNQPGVSLFLVTEEGAIVVPPGAAGDAGARDAARSVDASTATEGGVDPGASRDAGEGIADAPHPPPATEGSVATGGAPTSGHSASGERASGGSDACGCRLEGRAFRSMAGAAWVIVAGTAFGRRRRRFNLRARP